VLKARSYNTSNKKPFPLRVDFKERAQKTGPVRAPSRRPGHQRSQKGGLDGRPTAPAGRFFRPGRRSLAAGPKGTRTSRDARTRARRRATRDYTIGVSNIHYATCRHGQEGLCDTSFGGLAPPKRRSIRLVFIEPCRSVNGKVSDSSRCGINASMMINGIKCDGLLAYMLWAVW